MTGKDAAGAAKMTLWMKVAAVLSAIALIGAMVIFLGNTDDGEADDVDLAVAQSSEQSTTIPDDGDDDGGGGENGDDDGGGGENGDDGDGDGDGDGGGNNGDGSDGSGGSGGTGGGTGGAGSTGGGSGGTGGGGSGGGGGGLPPSGPSLCGASEFLGGLPEFVAKLGNPDLIPTVIKNDPVFGQNWNVFDFVTPDLPVPAPIGVPITVLGGFNTAYMPLAEIIKGQCPRISGDPHIYTIDGWRYDFQAVGEYVALRSDDGSVEIQIRTIPYLTSERASGVGGVALTVDGRTLVVDSTADELVTLDGEAVAAPFAVRTDNDGYILVDDKEVTVFWPDGFTTVSMTRVGTDTMSVYFTLATDLSGKVGGLMGNADGDRLNDPSFPDGTASANDFETINRDLADAWRVTGDESLFEGPSQFRADFPTEQIRLTAAEARQAREVCVGAGVVVGDLLEECTIDVAISGDPAAAEVQLEGQTERFRVRYPDAEVPVAFDPSLVGSNPGRAFQVDAVTIDGTRAWTFETDEGDLVGVEAVVPTLDGNALVVDIRNGLFLIDGNGKILWNIEANLVEFVEPLVVGDAAYVGTTNGVAAVGLDGNARWELMLHEREQIVSLGYADGVIIATTTSSRVGLVLGLDPATGEVLWQTASEVRIGSTSLDTAVAIADGLVVVEGERGVVLALAAGLGDVVWRYEPDRDDTVSGISVVDGVAYVTARQSGLTALDLATGALLWTVDSPGTGLTFRLAVGSGIAVMADDAIVWAVDLATGSLRWTVDKAVTDLGYQPIISGDLVYVNARPRQLVALSASDGAEVLRIDESFDSTSQNANRAFLRAPVLFGDFILVIDNSGELVAYR